MQVSAVSPSSPQSVLDILQPTTAAAKAKAQAATKTNANAAAGSAIGNSTAGTTFLNLLVKELQNQDPSAPMDSTAMVGQMISLNQLDQLISINQVLSTSTTSAEGDAKADSLSSSSLLAARAALQTATGTPNPSATQALSDPNTTLDFSTFSNLSGGK